jgi:hypothetical protein
MNLGCNLGIFYIYLRSLCLSLFLSHSLILFLDGWYTYKVTINFKWMYNQFCQHPFRLEKDINGGEEKK